MDGKPNHTRTSDAPETAEFSSHQPPHELTANLPASASSNDNEHHQRHLAETQAPVMAFEPILGRIDALEELMRKNDKNTLEHVKAVHDMVDRVLNLVSSSKPTSETASRAANEKIRKLRAMILTIHSQDRHSETEIQQMFKDMQQAIKQIPIQYYPIIESSDRTPHRNDLDTWLCYSISRWISDHIIGHPDNHLPLFGLRKDLETSLRQIETEALQSRKVEQKVLKEWTSQTLKITNATEFTTEQWELFRPHMDHLSSQLRQLCQNQRRDGGGITRQDHSKSPDFDAIGDLVKKAVRLAIIIRSCSRQYSWPMQGFDHEKQYSDLHTIDAYGYTWPTSLMLIFAPVYARSNDAEDWECVMEGTALLPRRK